MAGVLHKMRKYLSVLFFSSVSADDLPSLADDDSTVFKLINNMVWIVALYYLLQKLRHLVSNLMVHLSASEAPAETDANELFAQIEAIEQTTASFRLQCANFEKCLSTISAKDRALLTKRLVDAIMSVQEPSSSMLELLQRDNEENNKPSGKNSSSESEDIENFEGLDALKGALSGLSGKMENWNSGKEPEEESPKETSEEEKSDERLEFNDLKDALAGLKGFGKLEEDSSSSSESEEEEKEEEEESSQKESSDEEKSVEGLDFGDLKGALKGLEGFEKQEKESSSSDEESSDEEEQGGGKPDFGDLKGALAGLEGLDKSNEEDCSEKESSSSDSEEEEEESSSSDEELGSDDEKPDFGDLKNALAGLEGFGNLDQSQSSEESSDEDRPDFGDLKGALAGLDSFGGDDAKPDFGDLQNALAGLRGFEGDSPKDSSSSSEEESSEESSSSESEEEKPPSGLGFDFGDLSGALAGLDKVNDKSSDEEEEEEILVDTTFDNAIDFVKVREAQKKQKSKLTEVTGDPFDQLFGESKKPTNNRMRMKGVGRCRNRTGSKTMPNSLAGIFDRPKEGELENFHNNQTNGPPKRKPGELLRSWGVRADPNSRSSKKSPLYSTSRKGGSRRSKGNMEDAHHIEIPFFDNPDEGLVVVLDGHVGPNCAQAGKRLMPEEFRKQWEELKAQTTNTEDINKGVKEVLWKTFKNVDAELIEYEYEGATCTSVFIWQNGDKRYLQSANVGDSSSFLSRGGKALMLSYDHKVSDMNEKLRMREEGIEISDGATRISGLAVSRALGDHFVKTTKLGMSSDPYISELIELDDDDTILIVASDGLWDVMSGQEAIDLAKQFGDAQTMASVLITTALKDPACRDNITVSVVLL
eukprot:CAMPEP_0174252486 /NCGR_PEP_ID=MMETSP0439-20130205/1935_1 /TAXON_ID=0 /ORGANISM="Stereomyxa ramosa, Strain Chinc5" /LENGTH=872 /DNA_ID=CAMNT_0015333029 /DNA_START=89 /DNA_END=2707 /DNA_ORIENTATION=+